MDLPIAVKRLIAAQNGFDSEAYAACFTAEAEVFDEGETHKGNAKIAAWIDRANQKYRPVMRPVDFLFSENILKTEVSGNFEGSPVLMDYHFTFENDLIRYMKIV